MAKALEWKSFATEVPSVGRSVVCCGDGPFFDACTYDAHFGSWDPGEGDSIRFGQANTEKRWRGEAYACAWTHWAYISTPKDGKEVVSDG